MGMATRKPTPGATRKFSSLISISLSTVPKSTNATPRNASSAVIGNMYSSELSPLKTAAHFDPTDAGTGTAEVETADGRVTTGEEVLEDRRVVSAEAELRGVRNGLFSTAVGTLGDEPILAILHFESCVIKVAERLLKAELEVVTGASLDRTVACIVGQRDVTAVQFVITKNGIQRSDSDDSRAADFHVLSANSKRRAKDPA